MGEVYKARDSRLDRTVAIKVLPAQLAADSQFRERFEREARAVAALNHPHICTLHDIGQQDGIDYLVMEYLEGQTLAARLVGGRVLARWQMDRLHLRRIWPVRNLRAGLSWAWREVANLQFGRRRGGLVA
jgi:hypothetical protein